MSNHGRFCAEQERRSFDSDEETAAGSDLEAPLIEKHAFEDSARSQYPPTSTTTTLRKPRWSSLKFQRVAKHVTYALVPSFLGASRNGPASNPNEANSIAALDGLRGLACLFVFNEHLTYNFSTSFLYGYGIADKRNFIQWPLIRIFWSGFSMVAIFYVISGYVLSYKPLKQMRAKDLERFHSTLTSSVVRRAMRLYLPTIIAVLICGLLVSMGAFTYPTAVFHQDNNYLSLHEIPPSILDTFTLQMADAFKHAMQMLNFWTWSDDLSAGDYDRHLWTIVVEFRSSMVLFLLLVGVSRMKQTYRLLTTIFFISFCIVTERKDVLLFVSGMLIAEIDLIRHSSKQRTLPFHSIRHHNTSITYLTIFIIGLYLSSAPTLGCPNTPGYRTLSSLVPSCWTDPAAFLRSIGAVLITWSVANSQFLKPLFTNSFTLYLGNISYALYLVHGNVLKSPGYAMMPMIYRLTNGGMKEGITTGKSMLSYLLCALLVVPVTFWLADLFWRGVDIPSVRFAKWVEGKVSEDPEEDDKIYSKRGGSASPLGT